jgi:hypothetical protein
MANMDKNKRTPVNLPISSAMGGLRPGFGCDNPARVVQEIEDADYVGHLRHGFK